MWTFFKKNEYAEFFELARKIFINAPEFKNIYLSEHVPKIVGTDEAFALSAMILDIQDEISYSLEFPRIVHMKPLVQNWPYDADKVTDHAGFYFTGNLMIGNYSQQDIVHYVEKELITDELISILEEIAWKK